MKIKLILFLSILTLIHLNAFSLTSKILYLEKLKKEAFRLEQEGYYDKSIEISKEIKELSIKYNQLVLTAKRWYELQNQIEVAKQIGADKVSPEEYNSAIRYYKDAEVNIVAEDYPTANQNIDEGLAQIQIAIEKTKTHFENLKNQPKEKKETQKPEEETQKPVVEVVKLDQYYVVRLIPKKRDCLWRIAEYAKIYNDPWKWRLIYQANRNVIKNPDLIYPGQKLVIPPEKIDFDEEDG